ncbi:hydrophobin [Mycena leptocephala]|nr:hydrophobin [Mycena leptocephala]
MFSKLSIVVTSVLITLAAAMPNGSPPPPVTPPTSPQCCASVVPASSSAASAVAALVGLDLTGVLVDVGLSCSPITVIGNNCGSTTVTCDAPRRSGVRGLIAINCIPITL